MSETGFQVAAIQPFAPDGPQEHAEMQEAGWWLANEAAGGSARLIVLPEYFNVMGLDTPALIRRCAESDADRRRGAEFCRRHGVWMLLPLVEQRPDGRFNAAHLFAPDGEIVHTYDKTHLTITERREFELSAGERISVVETDLGRIGVMICYDIYFPEVSRMLWLQGAQIVLFPSLQRSDTEQGCMILNRARAVDGCCYLVRSSYGQRAGGAYVPGRMYGNSCIVAPDGSVLANAGRHEGMATAVVDPATPWRRPRCGGYEAQIVREFLGEDRRPELYDPISQEPAGEATDAAQRDRP